MWPSGGASARMRLIASTPLMPGSTMSISTASNAALREPLRRRLALADEFGLMAEFGQDGVEHDAAERIVLDAEQAQRR